jgi:signal transduction histidine kinase
LNIARWLLNVICVVVALAGVTALAGWAFDIQRLTDWAGVGVSMFPNTALAMVLSTIALCLHGGRWVFIVRVCAAVAGFIGVATFYQHLSGVDLGIDRLLFLKDWGQLAATSPGRMGPPAAVMFTVYSSCLLLATARRRWLPMAAAGGVLCMFIAGVSVLGYFFNAQPFYMVPQFTGIALNTSMCFLLLGAGLVLRLHHVEPMRTLIESSATGVLVRRALPVLLLLPVLVAWLRVRGEMMGWFDDSFATVLRTLVEIFLLLGVLWWMARAVRQHERAVHDSKQRYQAFVQNSTEGIWRCELGEPMPTDLPVPAALDWVYQHTILAECNDAMARMYGFRFGSELVGVRLQDLLPRNAANEAYLTAFIQGGYQLSDTVTEEVDKDGDPRYFRNSLVGVVEAGFVIRAWGTQVDITEVKRTEFALVEADRRKDEFLAVLAHELRNPLAPLMSGVELLMTEGPPDAEEDAVVKDMMRRQLGHMVRLIDDLLDISRINRGKINLCMEHVELQPILRMALESTRPIIERAGHLVETSIPDQALHVHGDPARLVQVCTNLLTNAAKFTPAGGHIRFGMEQNDTELVLYVSDNGIGLEAEHLATIFDMFAQIASASQREHGGLGIGLALVQRLVEMHGGRVSAHSDGIGKGTTMRVQLPLAEVDGKAQNDRR